MTNRTAATPMGGSWPSKKPRLPNTLRLRTLMKEAQRLEMAARIRELREHSPFNQPQVADKLKGRDGKPLSLRGYQKIEQRGTTKWERCEELAAIFNANPYWIWEGKERGPTPDVLGEFGAEQGDRIEEALLDLRVDLAELGVDVARDKAQRQKWQRRATERRSGAGAH